MFITKSIFVEYLQSPKLAWYHINDKKTYAKIQEHNYGGMDGAAIGQSVEDMVKKLFSDKTITEIDSKKLGFKGWHKSYHIMTSKALDQSPEVLYQAGFVADFLFAKTDFLVKNSSWTYDLLEVKSKNSIRSNNKSKTLIDDLIADVSFQKYLLKKTLWKKFSWDCYLVYLNKEFRKNWEINPSEIILQELVNDDLMTDDAIEQILCTIESDLSLSLSEFNKKFPYDGSDYFTYFGEDAPKKSIRNITGIVQNKKKFLYEQSKISLDDITDEEILGVLSNKDGGESKSSKFMNLRKQGETTINQEEIKNRLATLKFPLFFYDYETVSYPIPSFEWMGPREQTIVQYSVHKIDADGTITHKDCIVRPGEKHNKRIIDQLVQDLEQWNGTYIVRNKAFENGRNRELWIIYPEHAEVFEKINEHTFDLMTIFSDMLYFDRKFLWSSSIKKVLPVLTEISYDNLEVGNGGDAMNVLYQIQQEKLHWPELEKAIENLLTYCKQDTRAMVRILEVIKEKIA